MEELKTTKVKPDPFDTVACVPMTQEHWKLILKMYLRTYRGPHADQLLRKELEGYQVLRRCGQIGKGRYIRYMSRGIIDVHLRRGGWVVKCNTKTILVKDGRRQWRVNRMDNFVFVRDQDADGPQPRGRHKRLTRLLAEEALHQDNLLRQEQRVKIKANFIGE